MISNKFQQLCDTPLDINEHLPTLSKYAEEAEVILEAGVRSVISTWAFMNGLCKNNSENKTIYSVDLCWSPIGDAMRAAQEANIQLSFTQRDILKYTLPQKVDITFIDTLHCYGQLKRELARFAPLTRKYIIMHDTTVDEFIGEPIRCGFNLEEMKRNTGFTQHELITGLWPAVEEFLQNNPEWTLHQRFTNNNGLTILARPENIVYHRKEEE